jgi:predicted Zn finger-like uncharacterized protein
MPEENYTRCPGCSTVFRVTPSQLAVRAGRVRCGHCQTVFNGNDSLVAPAPSPIVIDDDTAHDDAVHDAAAPSALTVTPGDAPVLEAAPPPPMPPALDDPQSVAGAGLEDEWPRAKPQDNRRRRWNVAFGLAIPALLLLLFGQAAFHLRDAIASRWPAAGPVLTTFCAAAGCALHPLHEISYLSIDSSDLEADPAHKGLLILTATLRNRATYALAYPYLELTLTDSQDQVVVRRSLAPKDYAGGTADLDSGIRPNTELTIKLFIDASATTQAGYRVYLFYP